MLLLNEDFLKVFQQLAQINGASDTRIRHTGEVVANFESDSDSLPKEGGQLSVYKPSNGDELWKFSCRSTCGINSYFRVADLWAQLIKGLNKNSAGVAGIFKVIGEANGADRVEISSETSPDGELHWTTVVATFEGPIDTYEFGITLLPSHAFITMYSATYDSRYARVSDLWCQLLLAFTSAGIVSSRVF